jgi:GNS1/SUR4 family protein
MSAPTFRWRLPPRSLFHFPPDPLPLAIPPSTEVRTFASPFPIPGDVYNAALDWKVPVTIGALYASTALIMNRINRDRGNKPWSISKTRAFHYFVLIHNIFLAIFSALTFWGMIRALAHTWPGRRELPFLGKFWPGMRTENGFTGAADALCKMHGPHGLGNAAFYDPSSHKWMTTNRLVKLSAGGTPNASSEGRLWNEGLAFWGWWFYLSKFYEVLDTFIILMKGKRSSTLQTYHHTGAMACMWAGMRYMSPPIWMFAFLNSGIHAMMVSFFSVYILVFVI